MAQQHSWSLPNDNRGQYESIAQSSESHFSIEELGPAPMTGYMALYGSTQPPWNHGSYSLRIMPFEYLHQIMHALAESAVYKPIGFINEPDDYCEPRFYVWPIQLKEYVDISVNLLDANLAGPHQFLTHFPSKNLVTRESIVSEPFYSRLAGLATDCAQVDFTINAKCEASLGVRFKVIATSDMEIKSRDYNILFMRKPQPIHQPNLPVTGRRQ